MPAKRLHQAFLDQKRFGSLDCLRCVAIVAVVWHHTAAGVSELAISSRGYLGVDLFFVISGYLIVTLLLRESKRSGTIDIKSFYIRRTLRIFPVYYGAIIAFTIYYSLLNRTEFGDQFLNDLWIYLLYLGNFFAVGWAVVWSLAAEEQFYLVWPHLEKRLKNILPVLIVSIAVNQLFNFRTSRDLILAFVGLPEAADLEIVQTTFTPILLGVLLAHLLNNNEYFDKFHKIVNFRYAPVVWFIVLAVLVTLPNQDISGWHRLCIHITICLCVGSCVVSEEHILARFMQRALFVRIGVVSYGIYIFHIQAIVIAEKTLGVLGVHSKLMLFILGLGISYIVAELSFRFFERYFLELKSKFS